MNKKEDIVQAFTELAPRYTRVVDAELSRFWGWSYEGFIDRLIETLPDIQDDIILDVATGTGVIPDRLRSKGIIPPRIHALDITYSMLRHAQRQLGNKNKQDTTNLVCASAMGMPYRNGAFTQVICGLATHHLDVTEFIHESTRVLKNGGVLSIADAGGSLFWKIPGVKLLIRLAAYLYFAITENKTRAWAEVSAVSNVRSQEDWQALLMRAGYENIKIQKLHCKYFFVPAPLLIQAQKGLDGFHHG